MHEAADLGKTARHDEGERVVTLSGTGGDTAYDGDDILHGATGLDTDHVLREVHTERLGDQKRFEDVGDRLVLGRDDGGRKRSATDLLGMVGTRKRGDAMFPADLTCDDLGHQEARARFDTLGQAEDRRVIRDKGRAFVGDMPQMRGRHGEYDRIGAIKRPRDLRGRLDIVRQVVINEITGVAMVTVDALGRLGAVGPHADPDGACRGKTGDRRAP